ncbi:MAG TPA: hypothetical protein PK500_02850 [Candidatus Egerieousia sp.]|nr:hypothetical protein [Candidatus Egerieousia sp.]HPT05579.1 hypothetical protein [Candidatus Egerieousia sp.]
MKKILFIALLLVSLNAAAFAQTFPIDFCVGTWRYTNQAAGEAFTMKLKKCTLNIPDNWGGGTEECVTGAYTFSKNGVTIIDCMNMYSMSYNDLFDCPIIILNINSTTATFSIKDYGKKNGLGKPKRFAAGQLTIISQNPPKIKVDIEESEGIYVINDNNEIFPEGRSFSSEMILTKITE